VGSTATREQYEQREKEWQCSEEQRGPERSDGEVVSRVSIGQQPQSKERKA
jgi:hypothetical protein